MTTSPIPLFLDRAARFALEEIYVLLLAGRSDDATQLLGRLIGTAERRMARPPEAAAALDAAALLAAKGRARGGPISGDGVRLQVGARVWAAAYEEFPGSGEALYVPVARVIADLQHAGAILRFEDGVLGSPDECFLDRATCWALCARRNDEEADGAEEEAKELRQAAKRIRSTLKKGNVAALDAEFGVDMSGDQPG